MKFAYALLGTAMLATTTEAETIHDKMSKAINSTVQAIRDIILNVTVPNVETTSTTRRVWITYERGQQTSLLSTMSTVRTFETNMVPIYEFPAMTSIVTLATDEEIAALMANTTIGKINITDDPIRYPMVHSTKKLRHLQSGQEVPYGIKLTQIEQLWVNTGLTGAGITVCVVDSGLDTSNPDFDSTSYTGDSLVEGLWNTDTSGHGTHVTGTISAANNSFGVVGAAPGAKIHTVDVFSDAGGFAYASALVDAAYKCRAAGAKIISMSLGGPTSSIQEQTLFTQLYEYYGILSVAAAGNDGTSQYSYPASYDNVLSVGAVDQNKDLAYFSNFNNRVDLVAPGVDILSTLPTGGACEICSETGQYTYGVVSGTSQATPHVSGIAALLWSYDTTFGVEMIYNALIGSAEDLGSSGKFVSALDAYNALTNMNLTPPPNFSTTSPPAMTPISAPNQSTPPPDSSCASASLFVRTDAYPEESFVKLTDIYSGSVIWYYYFELANSEYSISEACLNPSSCYLFQVFDTYGDGICCANGDGIFELSYNGVPIAYATDFGESAFIYVGGGCFV